MKREIIINGRFLTGPLTGVQRTAHELVKALDELLSQKAAITEQQKYVILYSGTIVNPIVLKYIKILKKGFLQGNLWEQLELPVYAAGKLLINMCSIAPLLKRKQILFIHDVSFMVNKSFFSRAFRWWYNIAIPLLGKTCLQIVTVSNFSKDELIKRAFVRPDKIQVIYNAAEHILGNELPDIDFCMRIDAYKPYCLAVSNLAANKNFKGLSKAIKTINFGKYQMLIAGGGVGTLAYASPDVDAIYLGFVSDLQLRYLYSNASLFIFPSFYEGFGIPPLEAMILGCPVIASNTSAIPEVLQDACNYFDPSDIQEMGQKIGELIHNPERLTELKSIGYLQAQHYNWRKSASQLSTLIDLHNG